MARLNPDNPVVPGIGPVPATEMEMRHLIRLLRRTAGPQARELRYKLARVDPSTFAEVVLRDEETGARIRQAQTHVTWHQLLDDEDRVILWSHIESGKSMQVTVARTLFELGRDTSLRQAIVSNTSTQASKLLRVCAKYLESSEDLRKVFPHLRPGKPWTDSALFVERDTVSKDPSIQALGIHGAVVGARLDRLRMDDLLDYENTATQAQRDGAVQWIESSLMGRLTRRARVSWVGTAFHPKDALHVFAAKKGWRAYRYPVLDPETGKVRWPERWTPEYIDKKRDDLGPLEFARQVMCVARSDADARFKMEWIQGCLKRGNGRTPAYGLSALPFGYQTFTGVDLAVQQHDAADLTAFSTIIVHPDGTRELLGVESGRLTGPEIVNKLMDIQRRYLSTLVVENNGAQDFIIQFAGRSLPIIPFTTGRSKAHPEFGVEGLAAEMARNQWIIPNVNGVMDPEIAKFVDEMLYYKPSAHTGDRLMSVWFAREGIRKRPGAVQFGNLDVGSR